VLPTEKHINLLTEKSDLIMKYSENIFRSPSRLSIIDDSCPFPTFSLALIGSSITVNPLKIGLEED